jgi:type I restriction enzyme S subunit
MSYQRKVGEMISKAQVKKCGNRIYPILSMTMHQGLVLQDKRFKKQIASLDKTNYKVVKKHQLVESFPIDEGVIAVQEIIDFGIVSPAYKIWNVNTDIVLPKFLEMALRSPKSINYYKEKLRGSTARRRTIPDEILCEMKINCPPIEDQKSIVKIIYKVKNLIQLQKNITSFLESLAKSRFVEMFGDPIVNTKRLPEQKFEELCFLKAGNTTSAEDIHNVGDKYPYPCYGGNGIRGYVDTFSYEGMYPIIGRQGALCGNVQLTMGKFYATEHAVIVKPITEINVLWFYYLLKYLNLNRYHTGAAQPGLAVKNLNLINIPVARLCDQNKYAIFVQQTDKLKAVIQKSLDETQMLFDSLMQEYFG